jgi:hypothetical protein
VLLAQRRRALMLRRACRGGCACVARRVSLPQRLLDGLRAYNLAPSDTPPGAPAAAPKAAAKKQARRGRAHERKGYAAR